MSQNLRGDLHPEPLSPVARVLRRRSTDAERALWRILGRRPGGAKFRRQHPMAGYVLDFYCVEKRLAIEADGGQHLTDEGLTADRQRKRDLEARRLRVLRFTDREILLEGAGVLLAIEEALGSY